MFKTTLTIAALFWLAAPPPVLAQNIITRLECKPGEVRAPAGNCLFPDPHRLQCKPGQVQFNGGPCLTPDRPRPLQRCGEPDAPYGPPWLSLAAIFTRLACR